LVKFLGVSVSGNNLCGVSRETGCLG